MGLRFRRGFFTASLLFPVSAGLLATGSLAQEISSVKGGLQGVITDTSGATLPGATVAVAGASDKRSVTTDSQGRYNIGGLTPGVYTITASKDGFTTNTDEKTLKSW